MALPGVENVPVPLESIFTLPRGSQLPYRVSCYSSLCMPSAKRGRVLAAGQSHFALDGQCLLSGRALSSHTCFNPLPLLALVQGFAERSQIEEVENAAR